MRLLLVLLFSLLSLASFGQGTMYFVPLGPNVESSNNNDILGASNQAITKMQLSINAVAVAAGFSFAASNTATSCLRLEEEVKKLSTNDGDVIVLYAAMHGRKSDDITGAPSIMFDSNQVLKPQNLFCLLAKPAKSVIILLDACTMPNAKAIPTAGIAGNTKPALDKVINEALRTLIISQPRVLLYAAQSGKVSYTTSRGTVFSDALTAVLSIQLPDRTAINWNNLTSEVMSNYNTVAKGHIDQGTCQLRTVWDCVD